MTYTAEDIIEALTQLRNEEQRQVLCRFFKTGKGGVWRRRSIPGSESAADAKRGSNGKASCAAGGNKEAALFAMA